MTSPIPELWSNGVQNKALRTLLIDHFEVKPSESVVITTDEKSDARLVRMIANGLQALGAQYCVVLAPQLPFQGSLADPFVAEPVAAAIKSCDVWFDLCFPYLAGSNAYDQVMKQGRARYLLLGDVSLDGFARLYGKADFDKLFALQQAFDRMFSCSKGKACRITSPNGTDIKCIIGKSSNEKSRHANTPGYQTIPGSAIFHPELESVQGVIALDAVFHEFYTPLSTPLALEVDGRIRTIHGDGADKTVMDRALRRAAGGNYGHVIHLTVGLSPGAISTGRAFIEDIRVVGHNAVGFGLPWWEPGGGENHPDGLLRNQSLWIDGEQLIKDGLPLATHELSRLFEAAAASMFP